MELIKNWLSGKRNYFVGAILYKQFGTDQEKKKLFEGKPTLHLQQVLEQSLSELLEKPKVVLQPTPVKKETEEMPASADAVLEALRAEWLPLYQRMNYLRHELDKWEGNSTEAIKARGPLAFEILNLEQQCMRIWERREYYLKNGTLPEVKPQKTTEIPQDPVELGKKLETLKRNIRRNKAKAKQHPDNPSYPLLVKQHEEELQQIMTQLKTHEGTKKQQ